MYAIRSYYDIENKLEKVAIGNFPDVAVDIV